MLPVGKYRTASGSTMEISGKHAGISTVTFDEDTACFDCSAYPYDDEGYLTWSCDVCGGGRAKLYEVKP